MPHALDHRQRTEEWMDRPDADPVQLRKSLAYIRSINRYLRYTRSTLSHIDRFTAGWPANRPITVLDVATGSADVPEELLRLSRKTRRDIRVTGIDLHAGTISEAARRTRPLGVHLAQADATRLPFPDASFDFVMTSMFLHHLDEPVIVSVLREMDRVARHGIIVADLVRTRRALFWISVFTLTANPMVRHDAIASVRQAFTEAEMLQLASAAGVPYCKITRHFGHRFVLSGQKNA